MKNENEMNLDLAITSLRLDDAPSDIHLTNEQRLGLLETVWKNISYEDMDKLLKRQE